MHLFITVYKATYWDWVDFEALGLLFWSIHKYKVVISVRVYLLKQENCSMQTE